MIISKVVNADQIHRNGSFSNGKIVFTVARVIMATDNIVQVITRRGNVLNIPVSARLTKIKTR